MNTDACFSILIEACALVQVKNQGDQKIAEPDMVDRTKVQNIEAGNLSNENAERRADAGAEQPFSSIQAFDGVGECPPTPLQMGKLLGNLLSASHENWAVMNLGKAL